MLNLYGCTLDSCNCIENTLRKIDSRNFPGPKSILKDRAKYPRFLHADVSNLPRGQSTINWDWHRVKLAQGGRVIRIQGRSGENGSSGNKKTFFPIGRYPPRCDKSRKRDDRRLSLSFFFLFVRSTTLRVFQRSPAARSHFLKRGPTRCVGGHVSKAPGFFSLDKSHISPVSAAAAISLFPSDYFSCVGSYEKT